MSSPKDSQLLPLRKNNFWQQIISIRDKLRVLQDGLLNAGFRKPSMFLVCAIYALDKAARMLEKR